MNTYTTRSPSLMTAMLLSSSNSNPSIMRMRFAADREEGRSAGMPFRRAFFKPNMFSRDGSACTRDEEAMFWAPSGMTNHALTWGNGGLERTRILIESREFDYYWNT